MGFVKLTRRDIENFTSELGRLAYKKEKLGDSNKDVKKKEHLDERIEAIKRVLAGKDDEYDAFLDIAYEMVWNDRMVDDVFAPKRKGLKVYAKTLLKDEFEFRRAKHHLYYLAKNNIAMPEGYYDV